MKRLILPIFCLMCVRVSAMPVENPKRVMPIQRRNEILQQAEKLLSPPKENFQEKIKGLPNPFDPLRSLVKDDAAANANAEAARAPVKHVSDKEILAAAGPQIEPSGKVVIGGQDFLLFGQKRLKVGDILTITYENEAYLVEIVSIDRNSFTIRLNQEELVRPIK